MPDLLVNLLKLPSRDPLIRELSAQGVTVSKALVGPGYCYDSPVGCDSSYSVGLAGVCNDQVTVFADRDSERIAEACLVGFPVLDAWCSGARERRDRSNNITPGRDWSCEEVINRDGDSAGQGENEDG